LDGYGGLFREAGAAGNRSQEFIALLIHGTCSALPPTAPFPPSKSLLPVLHTHATSGRGFGRAGSLRRTPNHPGHSFSRVPRRSKSSRGSPKTSPSEVGFQSKPGWMTLTPFSHHPSTHPGGGRKAPKTPKSAIPVNQRRDRLPPQCGGVNFRANSPPLSSPKPTPVHHCAWFRSDTLSPC